MLLDPASGATFVIRMASTTIEWTDVTWNPVRGCTKISPGCKYCYAEAFATRFKGVPGHPYELGFRPRLIPEKLDEPLCWGGRRTVFVNSMSDLFQDVVPTSYVEAVLRTATLANWHTYQILTKRSRRMSRLLRGQLHDFSKQSHIWWGVSVENRKFGLPRIDDLRESGAAVKFLSVEPLLEDIGELDLRGIDWVIVGGESGKKARPIQESWVQAIRHQCARAGVKFFFKQWGGTQKKKAGRKLGGRTYDAMPSIVRRQVPSLGQRKEMASVVRERALSFAAWR